MADISKCVGANCILRNDCYRYVGKSSEYQWWGDFQCIDGKCEYFLKMEKNKTHFTERDLRLKYLTMRFRDRKKIGEEMIPGSFSNQEISEINRSIDFLLKIKQENKNNELWERLKNIDC